MFSVSFCTLFFFFFFFLLLFFLMRRGMRQKGSSTVVNWLLLGMLPTLIANKHRLLDHATSALHEFGGTFMFRGPWLSGQNMLITCSPENAKHMFNTHVSNYPNGSHIKEICYDVFGDGILTADGESWALQRRLGHARINNRAFQSFAAKCTRDKVVGALLPLLNHMVKSDGTFDLSDVLMRQSQPLEQRWPDRRNIPYPRIVR